jgi:peptidoglycan L-alanyl-D-glutamate endopeptidase CwlK
MTLQEATLQNPHFICPPDILARQVLLPVKFYSFEGKIEEGEIVADRDVADDIKALFETILKEKFPIRTAIPMASPLFEWDDERSMQANNTSAFNYRSIAGSEKLSDHALGRAIDINPLFNPYIRGEIVQPAGASYDPARPGTITADSLIVLFLKDRGWAWGGEWSSLKDYQHFEKKVIPTSPSSSPRDTI